jgi:hypothetical protein
MQPPQMFPVIVATQMTQLVEQHGLAQGNQGFIDGGAGSGTNADASPKSVGEGGGKIGQQWSGTLAWRGTIRTDTSIERKELRTQVTATASKGDPCAFSHGIEDLYSRALPDWHQHGLNFCYLRLLGPQCQWASYTIGLGKTTLW